MVKALVITGFGINCEEELAAAWNLAGAEAKIVHLNEILRQGFSIQDYDILSFPGGFSFGDDLSSGKVMANKIKYKTLPNGRTLLAELQDFLKAGKHIIGICNGFQMLVRMGFLPNLSGRFEQEVSLAPNLSGHFEDRWVRCSVSPQAPKAWLGGLEALDLPVRHGEGRLVAEPEILAAIEAQGLNVLQYLDEAGQATKDYPANPNGSALASAGLCDPSGQVFGLMPHPEAFLSLYNHPNWGQKLRQNPALGEEGEGLAIFRNLVQHIAQKKQRLRPLRRALLSVSDKTGLLPLAQALQAQGCELISTGGTRKVLEEAGIPSIEISQITGNPEAFGGRMKTISFQIESALLFDRERDAQEAANLGIEPIDLVVCNLYPFEQVLRQGGSFEQLIENIDIGGPTMIRSAAKNFKDVAVVVDPSDYPALIAELQAHEGACSLPLRQQLMAKAFNHSADYDALVAQTMDGALGRDSLRLSFVGGKPLRYGENSHQPAKVYQLAGAANSLHQAEFLHGKALSYNNILDAQAALDSIRYYAQAPQAACSIIKHNNPCGLALAASPAEALRLAWEGDPISAFGSIIAFNQALDLETVQYFALDAPKAEQRKFVEVILAPDYSPEALAYLQQHPNLRLLRYALSPAMQTDQDYRLVADQLLVQAHDQPLHEGLEQVSGAPWDLDQDQGLIEFGLNALRQIKSNSIVLVERQGSAYRLLGMGAGQPNRLVATRLALDKAEENLQREGRPLSELSRCILLSDAFFPFADNVELAAQAGIRFLVQPGGSIRDKRLIARAEELGISMIFSKLRHFKH